MTEPAPIVDYIMLATGLWERLPTERTERKIIPIKPGAGPLLARFHAEMRDYFADLRNNHGQLPADDARTHLFDSDDQDGPLFHVVSNPFDREHPHVYFRERRAWLRRWWVLVPETANAFPDGWAWVRDFQR